MAYVLITEPVQCSSSYSILYWPKGHRKVNGLHIPITIECLPFIVMESCSIKDQWRPIFPQTLQYWWKQKNMQSFFLFFQNQNGSYWYCSQEYWAKNVNPEQEIAADGSTRCSLKMCPKIRSLCIHTWFEESFCLLNQR